MNRASFLSYRNYGTTRRSNGRATTIKATLSTSRVLESITGFRNYAFIKLLDDYLVFDPDQWFTEGTFRNSVDVVDCYIDVALNEGWMNKQRSEIFPHNWMTYSEARTSKPTNT